MRSSYLKVLCFCLFVFSLTRSFAQEQKLDSKIISPTEGLLKYSNAQHYFDDSKIADVYYLQLTFDQLPSKNLRNELNNNNINLLAYKGKYTYLAAMPADLSIDQLKDFGVVGLSKTDKKTKINKTLLAKAYPDWIRKGDKIKVAIIFNENIGKQYTQTILDNFDAEIVTWLANQQIVTVYIEEENIEKIAASPIVAFVDAASPPVQGLNYENGVLHKTNRLSSNAIGGRNLQGTGVVIGVGDGGELGDHIDFGYRAINLADSNYPAFGIHGDHVAGSIGGGGYLNPRHKGLASDCTLLIQKTNNITSNAIEYFNNYGMVLTNNSYGVGPDCMSNGAYNYNSINLDKQMRELPQMLHLFAAGNSGTDNCGAYPPGYKTVLRYYGAAKNVLTVGAVDESRKIADLSSRGPVADGRIKPEICGIGINVMSTGRDFDYHKISGTSMSTPAVAASIGLMYQRYRQLNNSENPDGGLMKVIACNTADDAGNRGPDYIYGFGIMNTNRAVKVLENNQYWSDKMEDGQNFSYSINIPANLAQAKIMLYWHDKEAAVEADRTLINNLDLTLVNANNETFYPWVLSADPDQVDKNATQGIDNLNNIEQITLDNPAAGMYKILVNGKEVPFGNQSFYVTYDYVRDDIELNHPFGGEQFIPNTKELIHWDAAVTNTSNFKIEYSKNGGVNWEVIAPDIPADRRCFEWTVPTEITEKGMIRVSKVDGSQGVNQSTFRILNIPTSLTAKAICDGYIELNWEGVSYADAYEVLLFNGDLMESVAVVEETSYMVSETFVSGEEYWFAVRAQTEQGNKSQRTIAISCIASDSEACPWYNDGKIESLSPRADGRAYTSTALGEEKISIIIKNVGSNNMTNFEVAYSLNGENQVTEVMHDEIVSGLSSIYTFTKKADLSEPGLYMIDAWLTNEDDVHAGNDSVIGEHRIEQLANDPIAFPYYQDFEIASPNLYLMDEIGLGAVEKWDFQGHNGGTLEIKNDIDHKVLKLVAGDDIGTSNALLTLNLSGHDTNKGLLLSFEHKVQEYNAHNTVWVRGSDQDVWLEVTNLMATDNSYIQKNNLNLSPILENGGQTLSSSCQIRFSQKGLVPLYINKVKVDIDNVLSMQLASFEAERVEGEKTLVTWVTKYEQYNDYFEVEVADEEGLHKNEFRPLAKIMSKGDSEGEQAYSYEDKESNKYGIRHYRLKQVDKDGNTFYSDIKAVEFDNIAELVVVYPNPFYNEIDVQYISETNQVLQVELRNTMGQLILKVDEQVSPGTNDFIYGLDDRLAEGIYILTIKAGPETYTHKLTRVHKP